MENKQRSQNDTLSELPKNQKPLKRRCHDFIRRLYDGDRNNRDFYFDKSSNHNYLSNYFGSRVVFIHLFKIKKISINKIRLQKKKTQTLSIVCKQINRNLQQASSKFRRGFSFQKCFYLEVKDNTASSQVVFKCTVI